MSRSGLGIAQLVAALQRLAADPAVQTAYLASLGVNPSLDELALEFDDAYRIVQPRFRELGVSPQAIARLARVDDALAKMSGARNAQLWESSALASSDAWAKLRSLASEAIQAISETGVQG